MTLAANTLSVRFGDKQIIGNIDIAAKSGQVTVIIGPNGSGKTTLLRALTGEVPFGGTVRLNGNDINTLKPWALADMRAVLAQETTLAFPFTVGEVVRLGIGKANRSEAARRIQQALAQVDLLGFANRFYQELSGGERQRVQLARVLCQIWDTNGRAGPRWLFLDEPVSSLDIRHQLMIMNLAKDYARRGGGVIAVLHDLNLTAMFADHVIAMRGGHVVTAAAPENVINDHLLADVFDCPLRVGSPPASGCYVLPQSARQTDVCL